MNFGALEMLREACGWPGQLELDVFASDGQCIGRHQLDRPFALIGRGPRCDIRLDAATVSTRHAYVQVIAGRPFVVDLGSRSGIRWQGESPSAVWLGPEDTIGIGDFSMRLAPRSAELAHVSAVSVQDWNPLEAGSALRVQLPTVVLELASRSSNLQRLQVDRVLTLMGRASACKLRFQDHCVSTFHSALVQNAHGLWIVDLLGKDGVWADGQRVRWARLDDGARLRVGSFLMHVRHVGAVRTRTTGPFLEALWIGESAATQTSNCLVATRSPSVEPIALNGTTELVPPAARGVGSLVPTLALVPTNVEVESTSQVMFQQFAALHQQMLAQFQQSMLMMAQMFTTLRQEEMELLGEVLERLGGLKREVHYLKTAEKKRVARHARAMTVDGATVDTTTDPRVGAESPGEAVDANCIAAEPLPRAVPSPSDSAASAPQSSVGTNADPSLHAWLSSRIATLDKERQGFWHKFLATLLGN